MAFLEWDSRLDVGVDLMNDQHKALIKLMNDLHTLDQNGTPKAKKLDVARELASLAAKHFRDEERYMESIRFEGLARHKQIHAKLEEKLQQYLDEFGCAGTDFNQDFFYFLRSWLRAHIAGIDVKYGKAART